MFDTISVTSKLGTNLSNSYLCSMKKLILLILPMTLLLSACEDQAEVDAAIIADYIAENNLTTQVTEQGIHYIIEREGTGNHPTIWDEIEVDYEGHLLDGTVFDSSYDRGQRASFFLSGVISGWQIAIPLLKEGGKGKFIIPSAYAYGGNPPPGIPRNAVLVFDVELYLIK